MKYYNKIKEILIKFLEWLDKYPKQTYTYIMIILISSFAFSFIQYFYFTPEVPKSISFPTIAKNHEDKEDVNEKNQKIQPILKELQEYKIKRENAPLSKNDSLRIEYLFNQYQILKNGK